MTIDESHPGDFTEREEEDDDADDVDPGVDEDEQYSDDMDTDQVAGTD